VPWARPAREPLLLALVALATLLPVNVVNPQDISRLCLSRALVHGHLDADRCLGTTLALDKSSYGVHFYSDKAPGLAVLEAPAANALGLPDPPLWPWEYLSLWVVRVLASGVLFLLGAWMVGRVAEGLAPGCGGLSLVAFALGTLVAPFAAANFDHVPAGTAGLAAFLLAWRGRPLAAGLAAGLGLTLEYEAGAILVLVGVYVAVRGGRALAAYAVGALPGVALLGAYNWSAFGAPWHLSYRYIANGLASEQQAGFFGIHPPRLEAIQAVFVGRGGLLVVSPVVVAAAAGLVLLARRYLLEAALCAAVVAVFLAVNCGYFLPYGGVSPGPRFLVGGLPFLALGLGPVFAWRRRLTALLAAVSIVPITALTLTWGSSKSVPGTIWGALAEPGWDHLRQSLAASVLGWLGGGRQLGAVVAAAAAAAAFVVAYSSSTSTSPPATRSPS
jgi:hypothetical protein